MPPHFVPLHNPICPWDASTARQRAFDPMSITVRSNQAQLQKLGYASPRAVEGAADTADAELSLSASVTDGQLRFVVRPTAEVDSGGRPTALGLGTLRSGLETPAYLYSTTRLPVAAAPAQSAVAVALGAGTPRATPYLTPAHLLRNAQDNVMHASKTSLFSPRRRGDPRVWQTMAMEQSEQVYGARAHW